MKTYINLKELSEAYKLTKERFSKDLVTIEEVIDALDETLELLEKEKNKNKKQEKEWDDEFEERLLLERCSH